MKPLKRNITLAYVLFPSALYLTAESYESDASRRTQTISYYSIRMSVKFS